MKKKENRRGTRGILGHRWHCCCLGFLHFQEGHEDDGSDTRDRRAITASGTRVVSGDRDIQSRQQEPSRTRRSRPYRPSRWRSSSASRRRSALVAPAHLSSRATCPGQFIEPVLPEPLDQFVGGVHLHPFTSCGADGIVLRLPPIGRPQNLYRCAVSSQHPSISSPSCRSPSASDTIRKHPGR